MALNGTQLVDVMNTSGAPVVYVLPELNLTREFAPDETKKLPIKELRALAYIAGGRELIENYLCVKSDEFLAEIGFKPEPEYNWTKNDIHELFQSGNVDRLKDALDFAPTGVVDLIKDLAVSLRINNMDMRRAIQEKTGFNVNNAIKNNELDEDEKAEAPKPQRRVATDAPAAAPTRRVQETQ